MGEMILINYPIKKNYSNVFINKINLIVFFILFLSASFSYAGLLTINDTVETKEESNIICDIGISSLKVTGQFTGGLLGGLVSAAMFRIHPVTSGIGWIMGSSAVVYLIGNISGGKGNFWWTAASGAAPLLFFIIPLDHESGFGSYAMILGSVVVSLTAEITGYYITKPFENQNENYSYGNFNNPVLSIDKFSDNSRIKCPSDFSINIIHLNF